MSATIQANAPATVADLPKVYTVGPAICVSEWDGRSLWECEVMADGRLFCRTSRLSSEEAAIRRASDIALALNFLLHRSPS